MKKSSKIIGLILGGTLAMAACTPDEVQKQFSFNATMEQLQNADSYGSKVQLVNEQWTYWEYGDSINIISNKAKGNDGSTLYTGWLVNGGGGDYSDYNGVFITTLTEQEGQASQWFVGIHPARYDKHQVTYTGETNHGFTAKVWLDPVQHYRHDSSYARQVLPMIATYDGPAWGDGAGESSDPYRLDFHALASLVRLQLVNGTGAAQTIQKIELESLAFDPAPDADGADRRPLCGRFAVKNLYRFNAHLDRTTLEAPSTLGETGDGYTLTLSTDETAATGNLAFGQNELLSFYVVLPAYHGMDTTTNFHLKMTVYNGNGKKCSKTFTVSTRRNGITYMRAINISAFNEDAGTGTPVLVGNGTSTRPFKIYTYADLLYLRNCYNEDTTTGTPRTRKINGQPITKDTYIRIMRSDIVLTYDDTEPDPLKTWGAGIKEFRGHLAYATNAPGVTPGSVTHGITNRAPYPLFQSITNEGVVSDLNVICDRDISIYSLPVTDYSPMCHTNGGKIISCRTVSPSNLTDENRGFVGKPAGGSCFAGICVNNTGEVTDCACAVVRSLSSSSNFAGICKQNNGTISGCVASSPMSVRGAVEAGGICYENRGTVKDCYCDIHYTTSDGTGQTHWGGIVYLNGESNSYVIRNCYLSANAIIRSYGNVGGIVCDNKGVVDYCHAESGSLRGAIVGGIASTVSNGELRNCFVNDEFMVISLYNKPAAAHSAGGLAGVLSGGYIRNCFALINHIDIAAADATGNIGSVVGLMSGGTIDNCYGLSTSSSNPTFYGDKSSGTLTAGTCFLVGNSQTGVTEIHEEDSHAGDLNDLTEMLSALQTKQATLGANYATWTRGTYRAPYLNNPYSTTKKAAKHRQ